MRKFRCVRQSSWKISPKRLDSVLCNRFAYISTWENENEATRLPEGGGGSEEGGDGPAAARQRILGKGRQPGLGKMGEAATAAAAGAGQKRRRGRDGRSGGRRETEAAAVAARAAGGELGVAIGKVRLESVCVGEGGGGGGVAVCGLWIVGDGAREGGASTCKLQVCVAVSLLR